METWIDQVRVLVAVERERNRRGCIFGGWTLRLREWGVSDRVSRIQFPGFWHN